MIEITNNINCVGCSACRSACPQQCISMIEDAEGFKYPSADSKKCIGCNMCHKVCPVEQELPEGDKNDIWIGAFHKNETKRVNSSSGAFFYECAKYILEENGIVWGAAYTSTNRVEHIYIDTINDIHKLQKSKYVQSDLTDAFTIVKHQLNKGKKVLFTGTPCQIKAINLFFKNNPKKLYTIEVVCHGVPSPLVFCEYMKFNNFKAIDFRCKNKGWKNYNISITNIKNKTIIQKSSENLYMKGFLKNIYLRPSCSECPARSLKSHSDYTIGDFWGVESVAPDLYNDKGVSIIGLHTEKALYIWNKINHNYIYKTIKFEDFIQYNINIIKNSEPSVNRNSFYKVFKKDGINVALNKYAKDHLTFKQIITKNCLLLWYKLWDMMALIKSKL